MRARFNIKNVFSGYKKFYALFILLLGIHFNLHSQSTYYSQGNINFNASGASTWNTASDGSGSNAAVNHHSAGNNTYIIKNGHTVTITSNISVAEITVGQGDPDAPGTGASVGSGRLTFDDTGTSHTMTVSGPFTVQAGARFYIAGGTNAASHSITINGDITTANSFDNTGNGVFNMIGSAPGNPVGNVTFGGSSVTVMAGRTPTLNNLTLNGGNTRILSAGTTVNGNFTVSGNTTVTTASTHTILGNFTVTSGNTFSASNGTVNFDGTATQAIDLSGSVSFYRVDFDNGSPNKKNITGNLVSTSIVYIFQDAIVDNVGAYAYNLRSLLLVGLDDDGNDATPPLAANTQLIVDNTGSITFTGGALYFRESDADGSNYEQATGALQIGDAEIIVEGGVSIERGDEVRVNNNVTINSGYIVINGDTQANNNDSKLVPVTNNTRTLTVKSGASLYMRGYNNFPNTFNTFDFQAGSYQRYDANFNQVVIGNITPATVPPAPYVKSRIEYANLVFSKTEGDPTLINKSVDVTYSNLDVEGNWFLYNGARADIGTFKTHNLAGSFYNDDNAALVGVSNIVLDAEDANQFLGGEGSYILGGLKITNGYGTPTAVRTISIRTNILTAFGNFEVENTNGSADNQLIVDLDEFTITGGAGAFILGANTKLYTSSATVFQTGFFTVTANASSTIRFDRSGNQTFPGGFTYGNIEISGSGNKYSSANFTVAGDVSVVGGSPFFRFENSTETTGYNHTVNGNWNLSTSYTTTADNLGSITFGGGSQQISSSYFPAVTFGGTPNSTKTLNGDLTIEDGVAINNTITVNADNRNIYLKGNWNENASGVFTQTTGRTTFQGTTQSITATANSYFGDITLANNTTLTANSNFRLLEHFDFGNNTTCTFNIGNNTVRIGGNWYLRQGTTFTKGGTSTLVFDGDVDQYLYNIDNTGQSYDNLTFNGTGEKVLTNENWDINGNVTISANSTVDANSRNLTVAGNWSNSGRFQHYNRVTFDGTNQNISASAFHDLYASGSGTKTLTGNITLNGQLQIENGSTLDVSASNYSITVEEDWNNYGVFVPRQGTVTFNGGQSDIRTTKGDGGELASHKQFYNLNIDLNSTSTFILRNNSIFNDTFEVLGDLTFAKGRLWWNYDYNPGTPHTINISGSFQNTGSGIIDYRGGNSLITFNGSSGTHSINSGSQIIRGITINASGATYQLGGNLQIYDNVAVNLTLSAGTLDLNQKTLTSGDGGINMGGGTFIVDEGAVLQIDQSNSFTKTGGDFKLKGVSGNPATLTVADADEGGTDTYNFTQSSGDFEAEYYTIANSGGTSNNGLTITGGTLTNFANGTFTSGYGNAYMTLSNIALGAMSSNNVIFNAGPTNNLSTDGTGMTGTWSFVIAGGSLAGAGLEQDVPDGGEATGFFRWAFPAGFIWTGNSTGDWHTAANWNDIAGGNNPALTPPTSSDLVYINSADLTGNAVQTVTVTSANAVAQRITILGSGMTLNLSTAGRTLTVGDNITVYSGNTLTQSNADNTINLGGSWSSAGTFNEGTATVNFNGTSGAHTITTLGTGDPFYNLTFNASEGVSYIAGSGIRINNSIDISGGTFDASSDFSLDIYGDWTVQTGGIFEAGTNTVYFRRNDGGTQNISGGTFYNLRAQDNSRKEINNNIAVSNEFRISDNAGNVVDANSSIIFIGQDWENDRGNTGFVAGTGTLILNGASTQRIQGKVETPSTTFNNVVFQGTGTKYVNRNITVNGYMSIISEANYVIIPASYAVTGTASKAFSMTGGTLRIEGTNNFPTGFGTTNLSGGTVFYYSNTAQTISPQTYNNLDIRSVSVTTKPTKTLGGDVTVNGWLRTGNNAAQSDLNFDVNDHDITLVGNWTYGTGVGLDWGATDGPSGGSLIHSGPSWNIDADIPDFNNLELRGTGNKRMFANLNVTGNVLIESGVRLYMDDKTMTKTGAATVSFVMEESSRLYNYIPGSTGPAFPTNFNTYTLDELSITYLYANSNQTIYSTPTYGIMWAYTNGAQVGPDGNLDVDGDFLTNNNPTLVNEDPANPGTKYDFNLGGNTIDIRNFTPTSNTITFDRDGDQTITHNQSGVQDFDLYNVVFAGSGTKTLSSNDGDDVYDIDGTLTINNGVTVSAHRSINFSGATWTNNGTFTSLYNTRRVTFDAVVAQAIDPGANNDFNGIIFANSTVSGFATTINTNGLDIQNGDFDINANATANFGSLTHTIASYNFNINGTWTTTNSNLTFDRNGSQLVPAITALDVLATNGGTKTLQGNWSVDDLTIDSSTGLDVNNGNNYSITVTGNWINTGGYFYDRQGTVFFESNNTTAKTINTGLYDFYNLSFNQSQTNTRTYTMASNSRATNALTIGNGATLDINGNIFYMGNNDEDNPAAEIHTIQNGGTLEVDGGSSLLFNTSDNNNNTQAYGSQLNVNSGGTFRVVGTSGNLANVTTESGSRRIDINILSGATIEARYYHFQYMVDDGLDVADGATLHATNNFSDGTWSNITTGTGTVVRYLKLNSDAATTISNITFNHSGTPNSTWHKNVQRDNSGGNVAITFANVSGLMGSADYEEDGDATIPAESNGQLRWPAPTFAVWQGTVSTDWHTAGNWSGGVVPTQAGNLKARIPLGQPYNPTIGTGNADVIQLEITNGVLRLAGGYDLDVNGDVTVGTTGSPALVIASNTSNINIQGSWSKINAAVFEHGNSTVIFDTPSGSTASITPGNGSFYNLTFDNGGIYNLLGTNIDIDGNLTISNSSFLRAGNSSHNITVGGNITGTGATFDTDIEGTITLDGAAQTITDMTFHDLICDGTGTKTTSGTISVIDDFTIKAGVTLLAGGPLDLNDDVTIEATGVFNDGGLTTHTFSGTDWIAGQNSYLGNGTISFDRQGSQYIRQIGANPVEFNNLTLNGSGSILLGRFTGGIQYAGNINLNGNLTVDSTIAGLYCDTYLIQNTNVNPTGTFFLQDGEVIDVRGADNFPKNFAVYNLHANSQTRYYSTSAQTIRGKDPLDGASPVVTYGTIYFNSASTKTLGGDIDINGHLYINQATLDVSANNYSINIAGNFDNRYDSQNGSFIARNGTVTFDGANTQYIDIGLTGTQAFNNVVINKSGGNADINSNDMVINGNLNVDNGTFHASGHTVFIKGNMLASNGTFYRSGTYHLNATVGTPTIRFNGSTIYHLVINAPGITYQQLDEMKVDGDYTLTAGTFNQNGQILHLGDYADNITIFGTHTVSPGGTLKMGSSASIVVKPNGRINVVGTASQIATITRGRNNGTYNFTITGTSGNEGVIAAKYYLIEYVTTNGVFINEDALIDVTNNFSDGTLTNGSSGGTLLRIENTQNFTGANRIENISFPLNPSGGATNIYKTTKSSGTIDVYNSSGDFAGENYDEDPNNIINWLYPPIYTWRGTIDDDWNKLGNWRVSGVVPGALPSSSDDVIIPQSNAEFIVLNYPILVNGAAALANNITIEPTARITMNTDGTNDADLVISGDLNMENSSELRMDSANDKLTLAGNWAKSSGSLFSAGTGSTVVLNSTAGIRTLNLGSDKLYNLEVNVTGIMRLGSDLDVTNDFTVTAGTFDAADYDLIVRGNFANSGTFDAKNGTVSMLPASTGTYTINPGASSFNDLILGDGTTTVEYDITSNDLSVIHDVTVAANATLDLNGQDFNFGDAIGDEDEAYIYGTVDVGAGESLNLGAIAHWYVLSGGTFRVVGTAGNPAGISRNGSGRWKMDIESGATMHARYYNFEYMNATGIRLKSGANIDATNNFSNGTFSNGESGGQYLWLENDFPGVDESTPANTLTGITFNSGATYNIRRDNGALDAITVEDPLGVLADYQFERDNPDDPADAGTRNTGRIRWNINGLRDWVGGTDSDWNDASNWSPANIPDANTRVVIGDVNEAGGFANPVLTTGANGQALSVTVLNNGSLTIQNDLDLTVATSFTNSGTVTIADAGDESSVTDLIVNGGWTNAVGATFNPGTQSKVTLAASSGAINIENNGATFHDLEINSDIAGDGTATFHTVDNLDVNGDFTITDGGFNITDNGDALNVAGNFTVAAGGTFTDNASSTTFDGAAQTINVNSSNTNPFNNVVFAGTGTKTISSDIRVNANLTISSTLDPGAQQINLKGNWVNNGTFNTASAGISTVLFSGTIPQQIDGVGVQAFESFHINNVAAGNSDVQLRKPTTISNVLTLEAGLIESDIVNVLTMSAGSSVTVMNLPNSISYVNGPMCKIGDTDFIFPIGDGPVFARLGIFNFTGSSSTFCARYFHGNPQSHGNGPGSVTPGPGINNVSKIEFWDLSRPAGSGTPNIRMYFENFIRSGISSLATMRVTHWDSGGSEWEDFGLASTGPNWIQSTTNASTFSPFGPGSSGGDPLPVELTYFEGQLENEQTHLEWETAQELNNDYFEIQRSKDGESFEAIGQEDGLGSRSTGKKYYFTDKDPMKGLSYYRLKQVDFDGSYAYSDVISIKNGINPGGFKELLVFPNPNNGNTINVMFEGLPLQEKAKLHIVDMFGREHYSEKVYANENGVVTQKLENLKLASGVYIVSLYYKGQYFSQKLQVK